MKVLGLVSLILSVSLIFAEDSESQESGEVLIRCRRPLGILCENGHKTDEHGCPLDECLDNPCDASDSVCPPRDGAHYQCVSTPTCTDHPCVEMDHTCKEMMMCAEPMCANRCEYGYKKNMYGCDTCECKEHHCEGHECPESHICLPVTASMHGMSFRAMCLHESHKQDFQNRFPNHPMGPQPQTLCHSRPHMDCHQNGTFKPMQCDKARQMCFCVNDLGAELPNTRTTMESKQELQCVPHQTTSVEMVMILTHDFDDVNPHIEVIRKTVTQYMSRWLEIDEEYIEVEEVVPHKVETNLIKIELVVTHDGETDLAYVTEQFKHSVVTTPHVIMCHGGKMEIQGQHLQLHHNSKPMWGAQGNSEEGSDEGSDEDGDDMAKYARLSRCKRIWREHKGVVIVAGLGMGVFLCVILAIVIMACRKRASASAQFKHQKMDTYKENLAYQNEVYGHPDVTGDKEKVQVVSVKITEDDKY